MIRFEGLFNSAKIADTNTAKVEKNVNNFLKAFKEISENDLNSTRYDITSYKGYKDHFRLRIGTYRATFVVKQEIVTIKVIKIGSRGYIYK